MKLNFVKFEDFKQEVADRGIKTIYFTWITMRQPPIVRVSVSFQAFDHQSELILGHVVAVGDANAFDTGSDEKLEKAVKKWQERGFAEGFPHDAIFKEGWLE
jgi:hypothetical protein